MAICKDKYVTFLNQFGYNVIRHPRKGIEPLMLIGRQGGGTSIVGNLSKVITESDRPAPKVVADLDAAPLKGQQSSSLDVAVGLNLLGSFIGALGGKDIGVKAQYAEAREIVFQFDDVLCDRALPDDIGEFLKHGTINGGNPVFEQYVMGNGRLFVITEVVKARSFSIVATKKSGEKIALDVPVLQAAVGGSVAVSAAAASSTTVIYAGTQYLAFGFTCYEIGIEDGKLSMEAARSAGGLALATSFGAPDGAMLTDSGLLFLGDAS